ncbi:MFS transporter [Bacillus sp. USDA818B3_A]|uniref:MFS transporter n=1 Tax=Bacillus sp. USDA818B3_A TaxID=2698834 RepID=UPI0013688313|nr:MFS transporter [Bacillus sp. USDA818B3_A]
MNKRGWQRYHTIWAMLFLGWFVSYIDRTATGPVITWMIDNKVSFLSNVPNPHGLGGLIGSLFFAGFMMNQYPGGSIGDKFGHRTVVVLSIVWAGITTLFTGFISGLILFVLLRVLLGLGEGVFYSNDRSYIVYHSPKDKVGLGMGVVITGLSVGLTVATLGVPLLLNVMEPVMGKEAWRSPFILLGVITLISSLLIYKYMKPLSASVQKMNPESPAVKEAYRSAFLIMLKYAAVFVVIIMGIYFAALKMGLSDIAIAFILVCLCPLFIVFLYKTRKAEIRPVLANKNLIFLYVSFIPIIWHLWLYGFWSVSIVKDFGGGALVAAALVASFNGIAGIVGFPIGGKISDMVAGTENGRRNVLAVMTALLTVSIFIFAAYVMTGHNNPVIMSIILFVSGLFFFALQPVSHALNAEIAPEKNRGAAFGMFNFISEIGAVLSPVVSGVLRDSTGSWGVPLLLDGVLLAASCILVVCVNRGVSTQMSLTVEK